MKHEYPKPEPPQYTTDEVIIGLCIAISMVCLLGLLIVNVLV